MRIPLGRAVELIPSVDWFFVDVGDDWQGNIDIAYRFGSRQLFYLGGGLGVANRKINNVWNSRGGLNIFGGLAVETPGGRFGMLVEPRFTLLSESADVFWLTLGVSYAFGK